jgi:hypothetical protein
MNGTDAVSGGIDMPSLHEKHDIKRLALRVLPPRRRSCRSSSRIREKIQLQGISEELMKYVGNIS